MCTGARWSERLRRSNQLDAESMSQHLVVGDCLPVHVVEMLLCRGVRGLLEHIRRSREPEVFEPRNCCGYLCRAETLQRVDNPTVHDKAVGEQNGSERGISNGRFCAATFKASAIPDLILPRHSPHV